MYIIAQYRKKTLNEYDGCLKLLVHDNFSYSDLAFVKHFKINIPVKV